MVEFTKRFLTAVKNCLVKLIEKEFGEGEDFGVQYENSI